MHCKTCELDTILSDGHSCKWNPFLVRHFCRYCWQLHRNQQQKILHFPILKFVYPLCSGNIPAISSWGIRILFEIFRCVSTTTSLLWVSGAYFLYWISLVHMYKRHLQSRLSHKSSVRVCSSYARIFESKGKHLDYIWMWNMVIDSSRFVLRHDRNPNGQ